ncbi:MAG TPA: hypothetical protein EYP24_01520, partial [bacterium (Candidatus Stahlbacteria)]|nr:hypothetical protein [Candidatus Stahlbacteria bacterium]
MVVFVIFFAFKDLELDFIHDGLNLMGMTEHDLGYGKRWPREDSFRLMIINDLMDCPLKIPATTDQIIKNIRPEMDLKSLARYLDLKIEPIRYDCSKGFAKLFNLADSLIREAFSSLTEAEMDSLLIQIPVLWADENDTLDDTLKATFFRYEEVDTGFVWDAEDFLRIAKKIDYGRIIEVGASIYNLVPDLIEYVKKIPVDSLPMEVELREGTIIFGSYDDDCYDKGDVIIDPGGNDHYYGSAGSGIKRVGMIIDLSGDDLYSTDDYAAIGSGILGVGFLFDLDGDDRYQGLNHSIGSGLFGLGVVIDEGGNDHYQGGFFSEGAGNFGIGILIDNGGDDIYQVFCHGQGFGSVKGIGILADAAGDDLYYAGGKYKHHPLLPDHYRSLAQGFAIGWRPYASGGIGILYDGGGNDAYDAEVYAQGTGYWFSLGGLIDRSGNDRYLAVEYAQGAGIHYALGYLVDNAGSDLYFSRYGPAQGEGHDLSVGILLDREGDDCYLTSGGQGVGIFNSIGIMIDSGGNDLYSTYEEDLGQGSANWRRGFGGLGIFVDCAGEDRYPEGKPDNDKVWFQGTHGIGIDVSSFREDIVYPIQPEDTIGLDTLVGDKLIKELFDRASLWRVRENIELVDWARERLKKLGESAIEYAFTEKINTDSPLELRALKWLGRELKSKVSPYLGEALRSEVDTVI